MISYFCLVNKKCLQNRFFIIHNLKFTIFCITLLSWCREMAFVTVFAIKPPVVKKKKKKKLAKQVVSTLYVKVK